MYILALILSIILIIVIAKWDKRLSTIKNKKPFVIEEPEWSVGWIEYYKGRINIYKILIGCSFVPAINIILCILLILIILFKIIFIILNKFSNKLF